MQGPVLGHGDIAGRYQGLCSDSSHFSCENQTPNKLILNTTPVS